MSGSQRIVRVRRQYNQWVANQTLEDFALRFTAERARKWSPLRVGHTALAAISFLALEAIGGAITLNYGFTNAAAAILVVGALIFLTGMPISYYAAKYGVDIDLLTRGAGLRLYRLDHHLADLCELHLHLLRHRSRHHGAGAGNGASACRWRSATSYPRSSIIPLVTHGITWITRFQTWTQPLWLVLHILPFGFIFWANPQSVDDLDQLPRR